MALEVYNTLTRKKELFEPVHPGKVGIYCCGPTVYMPSHVGHMVGPLVFDVIKRYLTYLGYDVTLVINITDIDDKIIRAANEKGVSVKTLAEEITQDYLQILRRLGVDTIDFMPRATENIDAIIRMIQGLIEGGHAYRANGDVYFDETTFPQYGKLSHRDPAALLAGSRIEPSPRKRHPGDFALWKEAKPGEPAWESPWGKGRPGWHIECSAMSMRYLGETFDIHGGGLDLIFPHHENEIAQSEAYTGRPFVKYWLHHGLLRWADEDVKMGARVGGADEDFQQQEARKMSKSKGNIVLVSELLTQVSGENLRFFILSTHYRRPVEFSLEKLKEVGKGLSSFYRFFERFQRITGTAFYSLQAFSRRGPFEPQGTETTFLEQVGRIREQFLEAMNDDFNTAAAIGALFDLLSLLNRYADQRQLEAPRPQDPEHVSAFTQGARVLRELSSILGLFREPPEAPSQATGELAARLIQILVDLRHQARSAKNYALADEIRRRLAEVGVVLEDRPGGTVWRRAE